MEMEVRKSGDPFEVDPLPKTFYYPSKQKELSEGERKICLSPDHKKEDHIKSPADEKFLRKTNQMKVHEIPTRENGTTELDHSSSSKFDESWPSTERAMVSTPEAETEGTETRTPSSDGRDFPMRLLPNSTLARYIHRFRNAPPSSRQDRDHMYFDSGKGGEFWWLSPSPPSSSTPKEGTPPEHNLPSPRPSVSPKLKRSTARRGTSTASPISVPKTRSTSSPSTKSSFDGLDSKTAELQQRAKALLEKSESTLDTSSTEVHIPTGRMKQGPSWDKAPREVSPQAPSKLAPRQFTEHHLTQRQPRPVPPPEEDILYQWRLARKMERAQEQATKWGPAKSTHLLQASQPRFAGTRTEEAQGVSGIVRILPPTSAPCPSQRDFVDPRSGLPGSGPSLVPTMPGGVASLSSGTQTTFATPLTVTSDQEGISSRVIPSQFSVTPLPQAPMTSGQSPQSVTETSAAHGSVPSMDSSSAVPITRQEISVDSRLVVVEQDQFEQADVPSHMHLSCDILPCPHQKALIEKGRSDPTVKLPLSSPVVESMQEELHTTERDLDKVKKPHRTTVRESHDKHLSRKRGGTEDNRRSKYEPEDIEREGCRKKEVGKQKPKPKREASREPLATDVLSGVIGQVVSERLFATPQSSTSSLTGSDESLGPRQLHEPPHRSSEENTTPDSSSDNEFHDDEVLKMLRQRARSYREQLRQIDNILNQQASGRPHTPTHRTEEH